MCLLANYRLRLPRNGKDRCAEFVECFPVVYHSTYVGEKLLTTRAWMASKKQIGLNVGNKDSLTTACKMVASSGGLPYRLHRVLRELCQPYSARIPKQGSANLCYRD